MPQNACFIEGRSRSLAEATHAAAGLLAASRLPVFLIGACDVAGTRAAIRLAARLGGVIDHSESAGAFRELDVMRSFGKFIITPNEARQRADTVLLVGSGLTKLWPDMIERLGLADLPRLGLPPQRRRILRLGGSADDGALSTLADQIIAAQDEALPALIAAMRASNAQRSLALSADRDALNAMAEALKQAKFGVIVYSPASLDALAIEMLVGLAADLNNTTRFSTISVGRSGNAETAMQTCAWMTGFPVRTGFGRVYPEHDPWRFDAARLIESGEADALIWISSERGLPALPPQLSVVALSADQSAKHDTKVHISIGRHGRDHDGVDFARETQSLVWRRATIAAELPSAASVLEEITERISPEAAAC